MGPRAQVSPRRHLNIDWKRNKWMKACYLNWGTSSTPALARMTQWRWTGVGGKKKGTGAGLGKWAEPSPSPAGMAWLSLFSAVTSKLFKGSQSRCVNPWRCQWPGEGPPPGSDAAAPSAAGLVINYNCAVCSHRCKSPGRYFGAYLLMKTPWHFCKHIMVNYN